MLLTKKLEKLNTISRNRWFSRFPSLFPDAIWNGHMQREELLLLKEIEKFSDKEIREAARKTGCKMYYMSANAHTGKYGLDIQNTPQGGGVIAQANTPEECMKIALEVYGIHKYFIY